MISIGSIFLISKRYHPRVTYQIVPWLIKGDKVWFGIYDGESLITEGLRQCTIERFSIYFKKDMESLPRPTIVMREELDAKWFSEKELRHIASGLDSVFI